MNDADNCAVVSGNMNLKSADKLTEFAVNDDWNNGMFVLIVNFDYMSCCTVLL